MAARCPICTQELESVRAVRRHALEAHGVGGDSDEWAPLPGPTDQPGWYSDPWNSTSLRFWDGRQWSGKTAPAGSLPEGPLVQEQKRRWGRGGAAPAPAAVAVAPQPHAFTAPGPVATEPFAPPPGVAPQPASPQPFAAQPSSPPFASEPPAPTPFAPSAPPVDAGAPIAQPAPAAPAFDPWGTPPSNGAPVAAEPNAPSAANAWTAAPAGEASAWAPVDPMGPGDAWAAASDGAAAVAPDAVAYGTSTALQYAPPTGPEHAPPPAAQYAPPADVASYAPPPDATVYAPAQAPDPARTPEYPQSATPSYPAPPPTGPAYAPPTGPAPAAPAGAAYAPPPTGVAGAPAAPGGWTSGGPTWTGPQLDAPAKRPPKQTLIVGAIGVAVALIVVVVSASSAGHHAKHVSAGATPTTAPATTAAPAKQVSLSEGVLTQQDLGGAWTPKAPLAGLTPAQVAQGPCGSPLWAHDVAGYQSSYQDGAGGFVHTGTVTSVVREAPSQDVADSQAAFVTSVSYAPCLRGAIELEVQLALRGTGVELDGMAIDPLPLDVSISNKQAYVISLAVSDNQGNADVVTIDHVELFSGRYQATLDVSTAASLGIDRDALIQSQADRLAQRLAALPPNGTLASRSV